MAPTAVDVGSEVIVNPDAPSNGSSHPPTAQKPHEEYQYLNLIREILDHGEHRPDRTGTGTLAIPFPPQHRYTLSQPDGTPILPLLTT
ncbi:hypothetical protein KC341_g7549, partial [Hortaea werneckii]